MLNRSRVDAHDADSGGLPAVLRRFLTAAVALVLSATLTVPSTAHASGTVPSAAAVGTEQVLFRTATAGYGCFRIPALVRTKTGSLLAFAEARKSPSCADRGDIDLVSRRSTNGGRSWGPIQVVLAGKDSEPHAPFTRGNPAPVVDEITGRVLLVTTSNEATPTGQRLPWIQHSDDDGVTWSAAKPLGATFTGANNGWFASGPSHGIQLTKGAYAGRLVVGAHQVPNASTNYTGVLYSDDHGDTWQASQAANSFVAGVLQPGEVSVAELPDGSVYAAARNNIGGAANHRTRAVSIDGGTTMPASAVIPTLVTPDVQGAVLTLRQTYQKSSGDTLIFSGPADPADRKIMRIRYSTDQGLTWKSPTQGLITNSRASYSDLAELTDGEIGLLYEGGATSSTDEIRFNRFTPAQIGLPGTFTGKVSGQPVPAAGATTPDATAQANDAYLHGNATLRGGRFDQGLALDGSGDFVDLPYASSLDPGAGDFTFSTWFRYAATGTSPAQVLFWGYGVGAGRPQVWLRAKPAEDRLLAVVQGTSGQVTVGLPDTSATVAFGNDSWHHLSLVRVGGRIQLTVDGGTTATGTGVAGPVTDVAPNVVEGLRIGAKPDSTASDSFTGAIDEFRLYRQALTGDQLDQLRSSDAASLDGDPAAAVNQALAVRLPFQVVDGAVIPARVPVALTDDNSGHCASGTLLGGKPAVADGRIGNDAIRVDATHPGVEVPFLPALDVGSGDFTFTTWFRYTATSASPQQAIVWVYGSTSGQRTVWVRAQPAQDRLYAWVETDSGPVAVALPDSSTATAFGDGGWHVLALSRAGGQVRLSVDAGTPATASGLTGSLTANPAAGIAGLRLGAKPGDSDVFALGELDEFRLYHRALTATELTSLAASSSRYPADLPALWWSFEHGYTGSFNVVRPAPVTGPATPDSSVHCNHAYVRGGAAPVAGRFGGALAFDGSDDAVQIPYGSSTTLGSADFTISTWVKYSATASSADQVILWAYGVGATERQIWLRVQPRQDRLYANMTTDTGTTEVAAVDTSAGVAFGDGAWHHLALERSGGQLRLIVDGVTSGSATAPAGTVTYGDTFTVDGFQLGAKLDGTDRLKGSLDEFRIFRKALDAAELTALRTDNAEFGTVTAVRLPFEVVASSSYARM
ncbi:LamG-like jellyroll fold domain-containing protein [Micromonospora arborensis]|uniref:LamG-like jellyroll fold domain-containing protein n=1 Tax=Micromonospora arborensis TaxID=2116518 RepID=UPI0033FF12D6